MARDQVIQLSAINVVLNPHPEGVYQQLIRKAFRLKLVAKIYGDRHGMFSQLYPVKSDGETVGFQGVIATFTQLSPDLPWFNTETFEPASEQDLDELSLPDNLQPNHRKCNFYFDVRHHLFIFDSLSRKGGITAFQMSDFLLAVLGEERIREEFPGLRLTVIKDSRAVEEIIEWREMRTLFVSAGRPNPDFDEEDLENFGEWLGEQNADRVEQRLVAEPGRFLVPNSKVRTIAAIAAENGFVEATGQDAFGNSVVRSTKDRKPLVVKDTYDPDGETSWDAFRRASDEVKARIAAARRRLRRNN